MATAREIINQHVGAALEAARAEGVSTDAMARIMFEKVLQIWRAERTPEDIKAELLAAADHLDPDEDFMFMRP
ncbi:MAG: hypothetical protein GC184_06580 [Rhizobiales bacterium]|nr:hypothetical protein [Hyphomicrobiales bacterium]